MLNQVATATNRSIYSPSGSGSGSYTAPAYVPGAGLTVKIPCVAPYGVTHSNITPTTADVSWLYQYSNDSLFEYLLDKTATDPTGFGYFTTANQTVSYT